MKVVPAQERNCDPGGPALKRLNEAVTSYNACGMRLIQISAAFQQGGTVAIVRRRPLSLDAKSVLRAADAQ
jgi:hypothetical protein